MNLKRRLLFSAAVALIVSLLGGVLAKAAEATNPVPVAPHLYFQLNKEFGPATNLFTATEYIHYMINTTGGKHQVFYRYFPPERSFVFRLFDQSGGEVEKTSLGMEYSRPPPIPKSMSEAADLHGSTGSRGAVLFRAEDIFVMTNRGLYQLEVSIRLWAQTTNQGTPNEVIGLMQPEVGTNYLFGVLTSPPVRVQIMKSE